MSVTQEGAGQQDLAFASPFPPDAELQQQQGCGKLQHPGHRRASGGHPVPQDRAGSGIFSAQSDRALHKAWSAACIGRGSGGNAASECEHLLEHAATALPVMQPDSSQPSHSGTHASSRSHFSNFGSQISDLHSPLPVSTRPSRHRSSDEDLLGTATPWEEPRCVLEYTAVKVHEQMDVWHAAQCPDGCLCVLCVQKCTCRSAQVSTHGSGWPAGRMAAATGVKGQLPPEHRSRGAPVNSLLLMPV